MDDAFLFFAEICLCASVGIQYSFVDNLFLEEALITRPSSTMLPPDIFYQLIRFHKLSVAFLVLTNTSIFAVKFSFLFFFRVLVRRVHKMAVYWWIVVAVTILAWILSVMSFFLPCLYFDKRARKFLSRSSILSYVIRRLIHYAVSCGVKSDPPKTIAYAALSTILDILTDILSSFMIFFLPVSQTFDTNQLTFS